MPQDASCSRTLGYKVPPETLRSSPRVCMHSKPYSSSSQLVIIRRAEPLGPPPSLASVARLKHHSRAGRHRNHALDRRHLALLHLVYKTPMFAATRRVSVLASHLTRTATTAPSIAAARAPTPAPLRRIPSPTATLGALFSTAAASPVEMSAAKTLVDEAIKDNDVLVFSKSYCPVSSHKVTGCIWRRHRWAAWNSGVVWCCMR